MTITQDEVKAVFNYDPETGIMTYRVDRGFKIKAGQVAGSTNSIRCNIGFKGKKTTRSRLAFIYMTGHPPIHQAGHRDGNPLNDSWDNLVDQPQSMHKRREPNKDVGLLWDAKKAVWIVKITVGRDKVLFGAYADKKLALRARARAEAQTMVYIHSIRDIG